MTMTDFDLSDLSRRNFLSLAAVGVVGLALPRRATAKGANQMLYVGSYTEGTESKGIYILRMSSAGELSIAGVAAESANPSFIEVSPNGRYAYAVNEVERIDGRPTGGLTAFARTRVSNELRALAAETTGGAAPCYVSLDQAGRFVFVANYTGGSIAAFPIGADGSVGAASSFIQHVGKGPNAERQEGPHAHCIIPDRSNRHVLVADLGLDRVLVYGFDATTGALSASPVAEGVLAPGAGPRHLAFHPKASVLYVVNELDSTITPFRYNRATGGLTAMRTVPTVSAADASTNSPADIHVHPSGRFLYMSNRGHDSIAVFSIDAKTFELQLLEHVPTGGNWPRNFAIDPTGKLLLAANQRSNDIHSFRIDQKSGRLTATGHRVAVPAPVCLRFLPRA